MGTNYYAEIDCCKECGRSAETKHIGKSSAGWCFSLHVDDEIDSLCAWVKFLSKDNVTIKSEYGDVLTIDYMVDVIAGRTWPKRPESFDYQANDAETGPNNLVRHRIDGVYCVGHGEGTWDLMKGEFC